MASRSIGRTMLDCSVSIAKVTEVVDISRSEKSTSCERVNWSISPLEFVSIIRVYRALASSYTFHPKPSTAIHHLEEVFVLLTSKPTEFGDFEIRPEMAHIVLLPLHSFGIDGWERSSRWVTPEDLFRQRVFVVWIVFWQLFRLLWLRLDEHFPKTLGGQVVDSLVCGCISEDVRHSLFQLLDCNGEPVRFIRLDHPQKWITKHVSSAAVGLDNETYYVMSQKYLISGSKRQYHSYLAKSSCL